jgi:hypothetical protein
MPRGTSGVSTREPLCGTIGPSVRDDPADVNSGHVGCSTSGTGAPVGCAGSEPAYENSVDVECGLDWHGSSDDSETAVPSLLTWSFMIPYPFTATGNTHD